MQRRYNLAHLILASVIALVLTLLIVCLDAQARIAFESDRDGHIINNSIAYEIYVMDNDGGNQRNLTNSPADDRSPSWSPDGKQIAFTSSRRNIKVENRQIYVMDADGENSRRLSNNDFAELQPSWSPDGKHIAFTSKRDGKNGQIYVMSPDGKNPRNLSNNDFKDWGPSWSLDGKWIAFVSYRDRNREIYVMDADGQNQRNLTNNPHNDTDPTWFNPAFAVAVDPFAVAPAGKKFTMWGWLKQVDR